MRAAPRGGLVHLVAFVTAVLVMLAVAVYTVVGYSDSAHETKGASTATRAVAVTP